MSEQVRSFEMRPIGIVERLDGITEGGVDQATEAVIRVRPEWIDQLVGLEGFSHLVVVGWLDRAERREPGAGLMRPEGREDLPEVGVFATRSPKRPNPIGLCYPRVIAIEGDAIRVTGLDFWDGTPVVDIKGYFPRDEMRPEATVPEWLTRLWLSHDVDRSPVPAQPLSVVETERGTVAFRATSMADAPGAMAYINTLSKERTFILMQGEQLTLAEEVAYFGGLLPQVALGDAVHVIAVCGDEIVGIAQTAREHRVSRHVARLGISVAREWRGLGLGRELMRVVIEETERSIAGLRMIQLECFATNERALAMYRSFEFVECGRIPGRVHYLGEDIDEVIMTRPV